MKVAIFILTTVVAVLAEPPVPSSQYLPSNQYSAPRSFAAPSNQYGAPAQTAAFIKPNNQYGAPSAPSSQYGAPSAPSSQYGAPSAPSSQYGAPSAPNSQYGAPSAPSSQYGAPGGGYGGKYDDQSEPANYNFQYHVEDAASGNDFGHEESRQGDVAQGKYFVLLPDGRRQVVEYVADNNGYKPKISYEQVNNGGYQNGGYSQNGQNGGGYAAGGNNNGGYQY